MKSFPSSLGSDLTVVSLVMATVIPKLFNKNPICCPPGSCDNKKEKELRNKVKQEGIGEVEAVVRERGEGEDKVEICA